MNAGRARARAKGERIDAGEAAEEKSRVGVECAELSSSLAMPLGLCTRVYSTERCIKDGRARNGQSEGSSVTNEYICAVRSDRSLISDCTTFSCEFVMMSYFVVEFY